MAIIATRLHATESKLRFYAGWNSAFCAPEFCDTEKHWQYALLEIVLTHFITSKQDI